MSYHTLIWQFTSLNGWIGENTGLQRCRIREVSLYVNDLLSLWPPFTGAFQHHSAIVLLGGTCIQCVQ